MTDQEREEKQKEAIKKAEKAISDRKAQEIKDGFLNPFGKKTTYAEFLKAVKDAKSTVEEYCKGKILAEQLEWLENELSIIKEK